jgi:hypothetical protein
MRLATGAVSSAASGEQFVARPIDLARRHRMRKPTSDHHPGPPPAIRMVPQGIVFEFDETSGELGARLVIRCDNDGNVYVRITTPSLLP